MGMTGRTAGTSNQTTNRGEKDTKRNIGALAKPVTPDDTLAAVIGSQALSRPDVVKKIWAYVKAQNLQDRKNRQMINADDKLRPVFDGKEQVTMFEMTRLVSKHLRA